MEKLGEILSPASYESVLFSFGENVTPTQTLIKTLEIHRQRQGFGIKDRLNNCGYDSFYTNMDYLMERRLPNDIQMGVSLEKRSAGKDTTDTLFGHCSLFSRDEKGTHPYTDLHGSQMARMVDQMHTHVMNAQNRGLEK